MIVCPWKSSPHIAVINVRQTKEDFFTTLYEWMNLESLSSPMIIIVGL